MKAICGIIYLNNKTSLLDWKGKYKDDFETVKRIEACVLQHTFGMEINRFENTNAIPIEILRQWLSKLIVTQMYYFMDDSKLLRYKEEVRTHMIKSQAI
jgi:hypothetical protein